MHYRMKGPGTIKSACAKWIRADEGTTSRMSVTCPSCLRYLESLNPPKRSSGSYPSESSPISFDYGLGDNGTSHTEHNHSIHDSTPDYGGGGDFSGGGSTDSWGSSDSSSSDSSSYDSSSSSND